MRTRDDIKNDIKKLEKEIFEHEMRKPWDELDYQISAQKEKKLKELINEYSATTK